MISIKASIIIAAYNVEDYIERCINSVITQTESDIEVIIVNDGSTDKTKYIIEDISKKDNRVIIINKKNEGPMRARESGLKISKGEYVLFLDGDDWLEENTIKVLYNKALEENSDVILYNAYLAYDDKKIELETFNNIHINEIKKDPVKSLLIGNITPAMWPKFIKRSYLIENKIEFPLNSFYGEDLGSVLSLFVSYPKINISEKCMYNYYQRTNSLTTVGNKRVIDIIDVMEFVERKLKENNIYSKYKREFEYLTFKHLLVSGMQYIGLENKDLHYKIYNKYINYKISIEDNKYIQSSILLLPIVDRIRIKAYRLGYKVGFYYDVLKYKTKNLFSIVR